MATLARLTAIDVNGKFQGAVFGQSRASVTPTAGTGDLFPIGSGQGTLVTLRTSGTGGTYTIDTVLPSSYGVDLDIVGTMAATDEQFIWLDNDGSGRFDQAANPGYAKITCSAVTGWTVAAVTIP